MGLWETPFNSDDHNGQTSAENNSLSVKDKDMSLLVFKICGGPVTL